MNRKLYYVVSDCGGLDMIFVQCTDDGKYLEGWHLDVGYKDKPSLRFATYAKGDPQLVEVQGIERGTHTSPLAAATGVSRG